MPPPDAPLLPRASPSPSPSPSPSLSPSPSAPPPLALPGLAPGSRPFRGLAALAALTLALGTAWTVSHGSRGAPHAEPASAREEALLGTRNEAALALDASAVCPPTEASMHAGCATKFHVKDFGCRDVKEEVERRILGKDGWVDPKSRPGTYKLLESTADSTKASRTTGDGNAYVDVFTLKYVDEDAQGGGCTVVGCSVAQVTSVYDYSTNYCNMRNLLAGASANPPCKVCRHDIRLLTHDGSKWSCPFQDDSQCNR